MSAAVLIVAMSIGTILLRFLPFLVFQKQTPPYVAYLGRVFPSAIIGMLAIYRLKDTNIAFAPHGLPELIAGGGCVVGLQAWKRNALLSNLSGTAIYMFLIQAVFPAC